MNNKIKAVVFIAIALTLIIVSGAALAALRESTNYKLQTDVTDSGGTKSTSTNYIIRQGAAGQSSPVGGSDSTNYSAEQGYIFTINTKPSTPSALAQYKSDGVTPIPWPGGYSNTLTEVMKMSMDDPDPGDVLTPQIEVLLSGESFSDTPSFEGSAYNYSGTTVTGSVQATSMQNGSSYIWQARVKDQENFYSAWVIMGGAPDFIVDNAPPDAPTLTSPTSGSATNDTTPTLSWSAVTGAASYEITLDTAVVTQGATTSYTTASALSEGWHSWKVRVKDVANNWSGFSEEWTFDVDLDGPTVASIEVTDKITGSPTYTNTQAVTLTAYGVSSPDPAQMLISGDVSTAVSWITYQNPTTASLSSGDGSKTVSFNVRDGALNTSATKSATIILDTDPPTVPTLISPIDGANTNNTMPNFTWNGDATGVANYEIVITGETTVVATQGAVTSYTPSSSLNLGSHFWKVRAKDYAQNWSSYSSSWSFTVFETVPQLMSVNYPQMTPKGVGLNSSFSVICSEAMNEESMKDAWTITATHTQAESISAIGSAITGTITWSADSKILYFTPDSQYEPATTYLVEISGAAMSAQGTPMDPVSFYFTTQSGEWDANPPVITVEAEAAALSNGQYIIRQPSFEIILTDDISLDATTLKIVFDDLNITSALNITLSSPTEIRCQYRPSAELADERTAAHTIEVTVKDAIGNSTTKTITSLRVAAPAKESEVVGEVIGVNEETGQPTFSPSKNETMVISYSLNKDANAGVYIMSPTGGVVWYRRYAAGTVGGKAGLNQVRFSGISDITGTPIGNGIYVGKVSVNGRISAKFFVVVFE